MRMLYKVLINLIAVATLLIVLYGLITSELQVNRKTVSRENRTLSLVGLNKKHETKARISNFTSATRADKRTSEAEPINVWCTFTKVQSNYQMKMKFKTFLLSMLEHSSVRINLHVITDSSSRSSGEDVIHSVQNTNKKYFTVSYYDIDEATDRVSDIVAAMQPHFSSQPGSYYSDALFFLSLGLHRIAEQQERAIMFDIDTKFLADVADLFREFDSFGRKTVLGMAPELTPVYHHVLHSYRRKHKGTLFGDPPSRGGFPGVNSGVVLLHLKKMRNSEEYHRLLQPQSVTQLASKYNFKGHLGDQDFVTLLAWERPEFVKILPCNWNRQLCTWWRDHGYRDVFDQFFECSGPIYLYHGNCNTPIPA
ncbi:xyloside xylosyltransferase 1 [Schistocerca cancellata]|uniref:xyloside xylosyltransferase 1 n=1 Tax=Schistocerca cancellata TaxID=274614 RepID=UPI002118C5FA|nr:xyloside xylosyltransferase 1 [Schistocerca cancellata]